jgi:hypothetical protein
MRCKRIGLTMMVWIRSMALPALGGGGNDSSSPDKGTAGRTSVAPATTEIGEPIGRAAGAGIGAAGRTPISDDQRITREIPPDALQPTPRLRFDLS